MLTPQNMPNCSDPNNNGVDGKPLCNPVMWWNKGGVLRGQSPARIQFYRDQMEGPDVPAFDDMDSTKLAEKSASGSGAGGVYQLAKEGEFYLIYWLNSTTPVDVAIAVDASGTKSQKTATCTHLDYWNMTTTQLPSSVCVASAAGKLHFAPPVENYVLKVVVA
jgi:hypothetical protein